MHLEADSVCGSWSHVEDRRGDDGTVPLLSAEQADPRLAELAAACDRFLRLPENWSSYRSRAIDPNLAGEGLRLAAMVLTPGRRAPSIVPTAYGGVQLEWHAPEHDLEIAVRALGRYQVYHREGTMEQEFNVSDDLTKLLALVRAFPS